MYHLERIAAQVCGPPFLNVSLTPPHVTVSFCSLFHHRPPPLCPPPLLPPRTRARSRSLSCPPAPSRALSRILFQVCCDGSSNQGAAPRWGPLECGAAPPRAAAATATATAPTAVAPAAAPADLISEPYAYCAAAPPFLDRVGRHGRLREATDDDAAEKRSRRPPPLRLLGVVECVVECVGCLGPDGYGQHICRGDRKYVTRRDVGVETPPCHRRRRRRRWWWW